MIQSNKCTVERDSTRISALKKTATWFKINKDLSF